MGVVLPCHNSRSARAHHIKMHSRQGGQRGGGGGGGAGVLIWPHPPDVVLPDQLLCRSSNHSAKSKSFGLVIKEPHCPGQTTCRKALESPSVRRCKYSYMYIPGLHWECKYCSRKYRKSTILCINYYIHTGHLVLCRRSCKGNIMCIHCT